MDDGDRIAEERLVGEDIHLLERARLHDRTIVEMRVFPYAVGM